MIAHSLGTIVASYAGAVKEDRGAIVGKIFTTLTPLCHTQYSTDRRVTAPIEKALVGLWQKTTHRLTLK